MPSACLINNLIHRFNMPQACPYIAIVFQPRTKGNGFAEKSESVSFLWSQ